MTDRYAVFGNPIKHSRSPDIHASFARQTGEDISYDRQLVEVGGFAAAAKAFFAGGGKGLNITLPFKLEAFDFADELTTRAKRAGAINTLAWREGGIILGDNTDGAGMVRDIAFNLGWSLADKRILVLGAGGAVRGVLGPLLAENPASITIANRTPVKAQQLADEFSALGLVTACSFAELAGKRFDLVINGTSASLGGELPPLPETLITNKTCCYDMMYGPQATVFMLWAQQRGAMAVADGLGMLVEQAAESFLLWRSVRPQTASIIADMRKQLQKP